jgi:ribonuclease HII
MVAAEFGYEAKLRDAGFKAIAGVDEAGRGALAGPLVVAAVILDPLKPITGLTDSKLLSANKRKELRTEIDEAAVEIVIVEISVTEIDEIGIAQADLQGMRRALARLETAPDFVITDGFAVDGIDRPSLGMKKGDQLCATVSAASIVAKTHRDSLMLELDIQYPKYKFASHKGYGTSQHVAALRQYGNAEIHRKSFSWDKTQRLEAS